MTFGDIIYYLLHPKRCKISHTFLHSLYPYTHLRREKLSRKSSVNFTWEMHEQITKGQFVAPLLEFMFAKIYYPGTIFYLVFSRFLDVIPCPTFCTFMWIELLENVLEIHLTGAWKEELLEWFEGKTEINDKICYTKNVENVISCSSIKLIVISLIKSQMMLECPFQQKAFLLIKFLIAGMNFASLRKCTKRRILQN